MNLKERGYDSAGILDPDTLNQNTVINTTDGYDTDDFDIETPTTYERLIASKHYPPNSLMQIQTSVSTWNTFNVETKFWHYVREFITSIYTTDRGRSIFANTIVGRNNPIDVDEVFTFIEDMVHIKYYIQSAKDLTQRMAQDPITLEDSVVYDLHLHTLDKATSSDALEDYLNPLITVRNKNSLPCYLYNEGCTATLSLDEIRAIVSREFYDRFTQPVMYPPGPILGQHTSRRST